MRYLTDEADLALDARTLSDVWKRNRPHFTEKRFGWLRESQAKARPAMWLIRTDGGDAIGASGLLGRDMFEAGCIVCAAQAIDLVVDPAHRAVGPALALQRAVTGSLLGRGIRFLYAFPNAKSKALMIRAGYEPIASLQRWTNPLRADRIVGRHVALRPVAFLASAVVNTALRLRPNKARHRDHRGTTYELRDDFGPEFDALWSEAAPRVGLRIGDRGSRFLSWRFARNPHRTYHTLCALDQARHLRGYAVYHCNQDKLTIADLFAQDEDALHAVVAGLVTHARVGGYSAVTMVYLGSPAVGRILGEHGFHHRPEESVVLVYRAHSAADDKSLLDPSHWYLTEADRDV